MGTSRHVRTLILASLCPIFLAAPGATWGRTVYVDQAAAGRQDGSSWAGAFKHLQDALAVVVAGDEIRVAQGQYRPDQGLWRQPGDREATFQLINGVTVLGGFAGAAGADPDRRDPAGLPTILTGDLAGNDDPNNESRWFDNTKHIITAKDVGAGTVLDGLIIAHGYADDEHGAALYSEGGRLLVRDCTFRDNGAGEDDGEGDSGVYNYKGNLRIEHCRFLHNWADEGTGALCNWEGSLEVIASEFIENWSNDAAAAVDNEKGRAVLFGCLFRANGNDWRGTVSSSGTLSVLYCTFADNDGCCGVGGLTCADDSAMIAYCLFYRNRADHAGALSITGGSVSLEQCTFYGNDCTDGPPGGVYCRPPSPSMDGVIPAASLHANTCIFWANSGEDAVTGYRAQISGDPNFVTVEYCCVQGWTPQRGGIGNIGVDPLFVAPDQNDFHLKSQAGHWDAVSLTWIADDVTSPCLDAGDPNCPVGQEPFPNGGLVNMGVYGGTCEASKSWFGAEPGPGIDAADINGDGRVDDEDLRLALLRQPQTVARE
jgi:hypothetical protein